MAISNPDIANYKPFYIQKDGTLYDTRAEWGLIIKTNPYELLPNAKQPYRNDWLDENGDDEYTDHIFYEAYTFDVQFYIRATSEADIVESVRDMFAVIKDGDFEIYDASTAIGRRNVRYEGFKSDETTNTGGYVRRMFTITFKVNDPVTFIRLNQQGTAIVEWVESNE